MLPIDKEKNFNISDLCVYLMKLEKEEQIKCK